jgi:hypothetical protein
MKVQSNYFQRYYNNDPNHIIRTNIHDKWGIHFDLTNIEKRPVMSFKNELLYSCELMYDEFRKYTPTINVFFSGGTDSECLVRCFHEKNIPINPIIIRHKQIPESKETLTALKICSELNIVPTLIDIDLFHLFNIGALHDIAFKYQTQYIAMHEVLYTMEQLSEPAILGDDFKITYQSPPERMLCRNETDYQQWYFYIEEDLDGIYDRFQFLTGIPMIVDSFKFTPQCWTAMMSTDEIKDIVFNERFKASGTSTKNLMMSREFGVPLRQKTSVFRDGIYVPIAFKLMLDTGCEMLPRRNIHLEYNKLLEILSAHHVV